MGDNQIYNKLIEIPANYETEKEALEKALSEIRELNDMQQDLSNIIELQDENILNIDTKTSNTVEISNKANKELSIASGKKIKFIPVALGTSIGAICTLPLTIGIGLPSIAIGVSAAGGSILGGILGKSLIK